MAFPEGWGRKYKLTIPAYKVDANLTNFPALITEDMLPEEMFDADGASPALNGGGDIRFSADVAGATRLACEIVSFVIDNDPANGSAEIRVKVPSVSSAVDTSIYVWYDKAGETQPPANDTYGSQNVWDSERGRWHLNESGNGTVDEYKDSTANANHGRGGNGDSDKTPAQEAGKIGNGQNFDGSNDFIYIAPDTSLQFGTNDITIQCWAKKDQDTASGDRARFIEIWGTGGGFLIKWINSGDLEVFILDSSLLSAGYVSNTNLSLSTWYYVSVVINRGNNTIYVYINDQLIDSYDFSSANLGSIDSTSYLRFAGPSGGATYYFDGIMDEVAISATNKPIGLIATEYNNQNDPATFVLPGTPMNGTPGTPIGGVFKSPIFGGN